jgi:hypothetical protein
MREDIDRAARVEPPLHPDAWSGAAPRFRVAFLRHVEAERGCGALTRNARLAAVKSFFGFVAVHEPAALPIARTRPDATKRRASTWLARGLQPPPWRALRDFTQ